MKEKIRKFWTLKRHSEAGFTLVELIVVIAILAILGGVAVPAYSGYVKKANMQADQQLIGEIKDALLLNYYATGDASVAAVVVTNDGSIASNEIAEEAMKKVFGDSWQDLSLSYDKWGKGAAVEQATIDHFKTTTNPYLQGIYTGMYVPSFAGDVDELFELIEDVAMDVGGQLDSGGAALVQGAAGATMEADILNFANAWATDKWSSEIMMGDNAGQYGENVNEIEDDEVLGAAVANAAVLKARNTAVATYLRDQFGQAVYDVFANSTYGSTIVPNDAYGLYRDGDMETKYEVYSALLGVEVNEDNFAQIDADDQYAPKIMAFNQAMTAYKTPGDSGFSQAQIDAAAYYAMMDTVSTVNRGNSDDETYWNEMAGAVSLYGDIAQGKVELDELKGMYDSLGVLAGTENGITVIIMPQAGQAPEVNVNPVSADLSAEG